MKKTIISILLLFFLKGYTQSNNDLHYYFKNLPNSPSTATFLRYGDIQNSEFTGTNAPKIPLYSIQDGDIKLPLTLDYLSGNGIKVADEATSVGIGWNIGLPVIVQSVLVEDDLSFNINIEKLKIDLHYQNAPWPALGYNSKYLESKEGLQPAGYIETPQIEKYTYQYSIGHVLPVNGRFQGYNNGLKYDTSPDIFTLNLFGEKIEFFIGNHKDFKNNNVIPEFVCLKKGYEITFNISSMTFTLIAPTGIVYTFGRFEEVENNSNVLNRNFVLTNIKDKNDKIITIEYNQYDNIKNFIPNSKNLNYNKNITTNYTNCEGIPLYYTTSYVSSSKLNGVSGQSSPFFQTQNVGQYLIPDTPYFLTMQNYLQVSKITGEFGVLDFTYTNREDFPTAKLTEIKVKNNIGIEIKNINFDYSYSVAGNSSFQNAPSYLFDENRMRKRLFLKKLSVNQSENYTFSYKNEFLLPRKDSYAVDYWGYYNAGNNNKTYFLNPADLTNSTLPITDVNNNKKIADINYTTAGLLERINYPTQGSSIFTYESNSADNLFSNYNPSTIKSGKGVRLKSQVNVDLQGNQVEKTQFLYEEGYSTNPLDLITEYTTKFIDANNYIYGTEVISMNSTNNYSTSPLSSGDFIGYKKVTKIQVDNAGTNKGKIISNYSINPDVFYHFFTYQLPVSIPRTKAAGIENGMLLSQEYLDNNNQTIRKIINDYTTTYSNIYYGTMFTPVNEYLYICGSLTAGPTIGFGERLLSVVSHFPIFAKESLVSKSVITDFFENEQVVTKTDYQYNSNNLLSQKSVLTASQEQISEYYNYSADIPKLYNANVLSDRIGNTIYKNGTKIFSQLTKYDHPVNLNPSSNIIFDISNNTPYTEAEYNMYDQNRLLQFTTKGGVPVTIIWGYKGTQPIAKIEGATYSKVMQAYNLNPGDNISYRQLEIVKKSDLDVDEISEDILISKLNEFKNKDEFRDFKITTYAHDPLVGVKTIINPSGIREFYKYDSSNRLESIKDTQGKLIKEFKYKYAPLKYYNSLKSQTFTKNNCGSNSLGSTYTYTVPANQYFSTVSQAEADQMAQNDIIANGQNAANANATCTPINCTVIQGSGISSLSYSSIGVDPSNINMYRINMGFPLEAGKPWKTSGVIIGKINGSCAPALTTSSSCYYQGIWSFTISPNGDILAKKIDGTDNYGTTMNLSFTLLMN
ncbi:DUF5977 domain-containing protein [Chryseobacterium sp.]|uniref:DUF5977 domain-containing protein n=1 Tax=Chryseobacterium sp. TaxID=1871047 RepID=UPI00334077A6